MTEGFVHSTAVVDEGAVLEPGVRIWHFCHVMPGARIGAGSSFGQNCYVASRVVVGRGAKIQNGVSLYDGTTLEDDVFVGPGAVFTNVRNPRAEVERRAEFAPIWLERGVTIGANATLLPGVRLGQYAFVAAGAVVTRSFPAFAFVCGVPARQHGYMSRAGARLGELPATCPLSGVIYEHDSRGNCIERG